MPHPRPPGPGNCGRIENCGQGLHGMTRGVLVFTLASIVSWGAGEAVDWAPDKIAGPQPAAQASVNEMSELMKAIGQAQQ